ncbi:MAG TPA: S8 family serine peptidase [Syntrophorhabdaceae bacterium]
MDGKIVECRKRLLITAIAMGMAVLIPFLEAAAAAPTVGDGGKKVRSAGGHKALSSTIESRGSVKVLVRLDTPYSADHSLSGNRAGAQRIAIRDSQKALLSELAGSGLTPAGVYQYNYIPYMTMSIDRVTLDRLLASRKVTEISEDVPVPPMAVAGWDITLIGANTLHAQGVTGKGLTVAVLDTGVDKNHPYLAGAVVSEACYSSNDSTYGSTSLCPGGVTESSDLDSALPYGSGCPDGECDHGTHVSGTIAGRSDIPGSPGPGVAPGAGIIAIQVFSLFPAGFCGTAPCALAFTSDLVKALERVYALRDTYKIASANMSLGGGQYPSPGACDTANGATKAAIDNLRGAGIATVISSGNSGYCGSMGAPGCISTAISVGATDSDDEVASYSNSASFLTLLAPGSGITSSIPHSAYKTWNGTSMAAPHVAGSWALMKEKSGTASVDEVLLALTSTGKSLTDGKCHSVPVTKQRINVHEAYNSMGPAVTLAVLKSGTGSGTITSTPSGISCGSACSMGFATGVSVTLTASPTGDSVFTGWSGSGCSGTGPCTVTMDSAKSVTAEFTLGRLLAVSLAGPGSGTVTSSPSGINCGAQCSARFLPGVQVTLTPAPATGSAFAYWTGGCVGAATPCKVVMSADTAVQAVFYPVNGKKLKLNIARKAASSGAGTITSGDGMIDCGATCGKMYYPGTPVTLTAAPSENSIFTDWSVSGLSGACSGTGPTCSITMDRAKTVTASFTGPRILHVSRKRINDGDGTVTGSPAGIDCGAACRGLYPLNTMVTLSATPVPGSVFAGWSNGCSGAGATCSITMDRAKTVSASFVGPYTLKIVKKEKKKGAGTVTSSPAGIDCGAACQAALLHNMSVTLSAVPAVGSTFTGWSGSGCSGTSPTCTVVMSRARTVSAAFAGP